MGILSSRMPTLVCPRVPFSKPTPGAFFRVAMANPQMCLRAGKEIPREGGWAKENLFFAMLVFKKSEMSSQRPLLTSLGQALFPCCFCPFSLFHLSFAKFLAFAKFLVLVYIWLLALSLPVPVPVLLQNCILASLGLAGASVGHLT